jgi:hypothetical protein
MALDPYVSLDVMNKEMLHVCRSYGRVSADIFDGCYLICHRRKKSSPGWHLNMQSLLDAGHCKEERKKR